MSPDEGQEELEEVQAEIKKKDEEVRSLPLLAAAICLFAKPCLILCCNSYLLIGPSLPRFML